MAVSPAHALILMTWFSPAYPVGAFAYSHGLEWAQEAGDVRDAATLEGWINDVISHGAGRHDAILLALARTAALAADREGVAAITELALAYASSSERRLETVTQGAGFLAVTRAAWPTDALSLLPPAPADIAYPVAVGVAAAGHGLPAVAVVPAFLQAFCANLVSAAVRLGVVGQTDGQRLTARLTPLVARIAQDAGEAGLDDLGGAAFRSDMAALRHETQYSRLFRS